MIQPYESLAVLLISAAGVRIDVWTFVDKFINYVKWTLMSRRMYLKMDPENEAQPRSLFLLKSTSNSVKNKTGYILYGTSKYSTLEVF